jgi:hypothetical protein
MDAKQLTKNFIKSVEQNRPAKLNLSFDEEGSHYIVNAELHPVRGLEICINYEFREYSVFLSIVKQYYNL